MLIWIGTSPFQHGTSRVKVVQRSDDKPSAIVSNTCVRCAMRIVGASPLHTLIPKKVPRILRPEPQQRHFLPPVPPPVAAHFRAILPARNINRMVGAKKEEGGEVTRGHYWTILRTLLPVLLSTTHVLIPLCPPPRSLLFLQIALLLLVLLPPTPPTR